MQKKLLLTAVLGGLMAIQGVRADDPIKEATYSKFFDRADGLMPGRTVQEQDLRKDGEWEIIGGKRQDSSDGIVVEAQADSVELIWRGGFETDLTGIPLNIQIGIDPAVPARVMFHVLNLTEDRFDRQGGWREIAPGASSVLKYTPTMPARGMADRQFGGFKLLIEGEGLQGRKIRLADLKLSREFVEGFFRYTVDVPEGEIWEAVAEVGACVVLYVNGERVDDESIILPRPLRPSGGRMYGSVRVPFKSYIKSGRNVIGMHRPLTRGAAPAAYLRGSVVMASGERVLLDSGTNWVWNYEAPADWFAPDYDDSGWRQIFKHADMPKEMGLSSYYKGEEAVASPISNLGLSYRHRGAMPCYDGLVKLRNPTDKKFFFDERNPFRLQVLLPPGFQKQKPELAWEIHRYSAGDDAGTSVAGTSVTDTSVADTFAEVAQGRVTDFVPCRAFACETPSVAGGSESWSPRSQGEGGSDRDRRSRLQVEGEAVPSRDAGSPQVRPPGKLELNVSSAEGSAESLAGEINSIKLARGIYVLTSRLLLNGEVVEEREPEVMVVTGKIGMPKSAGDFWEQDLNLTLETVVDFTDPFDPHPSFETDHKGPIPGAVLSWGPEYYHLMLQPLIVQRDKLKYRTTRPVDRAQFTYKVNFENPGDWYLLVLEYPDDDERWIGVSCNASSRMKPPMRGQKRPDASSKCGPTIWTGGKYPNTGKMLEMKWLYRPDPGPHAINVMSLMKDKEAAASKLRIYHVADRLPELNVGDISAAEQRRFGMLTERTHTWESGIYNLFSSFTADEVPDSQHGNIAAGRISNNAVREACDYLYLLEDAASHYAEYMRFAGQNLHVMGCFQYSDDNTASRYFTGDPRLHDSSENILARVLAANDLMFYASVEFVSSERFKGDRNPDWFFADRYGERPMSQWAGKPLNLNFLHPEVEDEMMEIARQLAIKFQHQPSFLGINWTAYFAGFMLPSFRTYKYPLNSEDDPFENGYDDLTIGLFEQDTKIKVPVAQDNPEPGTVNSEPSSKYQQRYQFLTSPEMKPIWAAWRSKRMAGFFAKMQQVISEVRPDLEVVAGCYLDGNFHIDEWQGQNIPFKDYLNQWGWGAEAFNQKDNIWLTPWLFAAARHHPASDAMGYAMGWQANKTPSFYQAFDGIARRSIMLLTGWIEVERCAANFPYRQNWPRPYQQTMMGQQREEMAMEPYTQALIGMDPQMVMMGFTDVSPYIGVEEMQRKFTRVLRRLPWERFEPVLDTGLNTDLAIRGLHQDDAYLFYVANPGYWPAKGKITLENAGEVFDLVSGKPVKINAGVMQVSLEPFGIAAFRASPSADQGLRTKDQGPLPAITSWSTDPVSEKELAHMRNIIERARKEVERSGMEEFLEADDYAVLTDTIATAEKALTENRNVAAWSALTDAPFWTILHQKTPEIKYVEFTRRREMVAPRLSADLAPKVDGNLDDRVWSDAFTRAQSPFVADTKAWSDVPSFLRVASVGNRLYIALAFEDPEPEKIRDTTDKDNVNKTIWGSKDDMLALFIRPNESNYYQLAVTVGGAQFDQLNRLKHGVRIVDYEYAPNWKAVTARTDKGWNVEIEIDVKEAFGEEIAEGAEWRMNFHRQFGLNRYPMASWSYNPGQWHSLEHMGVVRFESP